MIVQPHVDASWLVGYGCIRVVHHVHWHDHGYAYDVPRVTTFEMHVIHTCHAGGQFQYNSYATGACRRSHRHPAISRSMMQRQWDTHYGICPMLPSSLRDTATYHTTHVGAARQVGDLVQSMCVMPHRHDAPRVGIDDALGRVTAQHTSVSGSSPASRVGGWFEAPATQWCVAHELAGSPRGSGAGVATAVVTSDYFHGSKSCGHIVGTRDRGS